jgi:DNA polymerase I
MTESINKLLLVDGHSLAYRAFHALPVDKFHSPQGIPVNAVYGLTSMLINMLAEHQPTHLAVCFDEGRNTFRKKLFPEYKANRAASPDDFKVQVSLIRGLVDAFGIKSFSDIDYEADDLIATLTNKAVQDNLPTFIVTSDRDSFQLISESTVVLYPKKGLSEVVQMNETELFAKYGLTPAQYPDFAALRGDPSDNLPGIPGVGEKTATSWIQKYGSLQKLIQEQDQVSGKVGESLRANVAILEKNRNLTQLVADIPIPVSVEDLRWQPSDANKAITFCTELGFKSLIPKLKNLIGEYADVSKLDLSNNQSNEKSLTIIDNLVWNLNNGEVLKQQFATAFELDSILREHVGKGEVAIADLKDLAKKFLVLDSKLDIEIAAKLKDVLICEYLINPGSRPTLESLVVGDQTDQLFQEESSIENLLHGVSASFSRVRENGDWELVSKLYESLEAPVALVLAEMELAGIAIDISALKEMIQQKLNEQIQLENTGHALHGREFNFASPKQLQEVLFVERGLSKTKKTKTGFTTDAEALEFLISKHPEDQLLSIIQQWRETSKIKQMLISLQDALVGNRIHTSFMQTVAATGRLSSTKPNLQNVPIRTDAGRAIRGLFVSDKPYGELISADYSQIELRVMAHLAQDDALIESFKSGEDLHISVASQIFGLPIGEITPELRSQVKAVSYGLAYGLSSYGLSQSLKIDVSEADKLMSTFFERFAGVRDYLKSIVEVARERGYTETILGRRRYLPDLNHENRFRREVAERAALNAPIQGSAADIIKLAMVKVNHELIDSGLQGRLLLQVHDELVLESNLKDLEATKSLVQRVMQNVIELSVPLDVSVGSGNSWLTAAH